MQDCELYKLISYATFVTLQHGGEGRLNEKFANAMQHIVSDDVRQNCLALTLQECVCIEVHMVVLFHAKTC